MIYHVPDGAFYAKTHVTVECFDSESAAIAAGYRRSKR
jgi:methylphosphotriester-DNA--protein-cysteine methyltransferase